MRFNHVRRREFITLLGGAAAAWPLAAQAQPPGRMREIAIWMSRPNDAEGQRHATAFREGLQALGWTVGRNIRADYHWVTGDIDRMRMAKEIVDRKADFVLTLKRNQGPLFAAAQALLAKAASAAPSAETRDVDHGRAELRRAVVVAAPDLAETHSFRGLTAIGLIESVRELDGKREETTRLFAL